MSQKPSISEIIKILSKNEEIKDIFRYNRYTKDIEFDNNNILFGDNENIITDEHIVQLKYYIDKTHGIDLYEKTIENCCYLLSSQRAYHPIKDYLNRLKWDGLNRCDRWLIEICNAKNDIYIQNAGKYVLIAAVNRIFHPGIQFDHMLILEGAQGGGKSTMLNVLGGEWYLDTQLSTSENKKDLIDVMRTGWIIEIADLAGFRKHEVDYLRSFITRKVDRVRLAYGRRAENFKRQCVFIGTHNPSGDNQYFKDDTGNRRFWPVQCNGKINVELMRQWRDQLWAEAVVKYRNKEQYYFTDAESLEILDSLHRDREVEIPMYQKIELYIKNKGYVSIDQILTDVFNINNIGSLSFADQRSKTTMIGICMRKNGWEKGKGEHKNYYFNPLLHKNTGEW